jgi:hypothetical protein
MRKGNTSNDLETKPMIPSHDNIGLVKIAEEHQTEDVPHENDDFSRNPRGRAESHRIVR